MYPKGLYKGKVSDWAHVELAVKGGTVVHLVVNNEEEEKAAIANGFDHGAKMIEPEEPKRPILKLKKDE